MRRKVDIDNLLEEYMALTEFNFKSSYNKIDHNIAGILLPCMRMPSNTIALQATLGVKFTL